MWLCCKVLWIKNLPQLEFRPRPGFEYVLCLEYREQVVQTDVTWDVYLTSLEKYSLIIQ